MVFTDALRTGCDTRAWIPVVRHADKEHLSKLPLLYLYPDLVEYVPSFQILPQIFRQRGIGFTGVISV